MEKLTTGDNGQWDLQKSEESDEALVKRAPKGVDPDKHESCVMDVKAKGHDVGSAHAICTASMKKKEKAVEPEVVPAPTREQLEQEVDRGGWRHPDVPVMKPVKQIDEVEKGDVVDMKSRQVTSSIPTEKVPDTRTKDEKIADAMSTQQTNQIKNKKEKAFQQVMDKWVAKEELSLSENGQWSIESVDKAEKNLMMPNPQEEKFQQWKQTQVKQAAPIKPTTMAPIKGSVPSTIKKSDEDLDKAEPKEMGRGGKPKNISMFKPEHMHQVLKMPIHEAKAHAHSIVDASPAHDENKRKAKAMIDKSPSTKHLAFGMSSFMLASEGLSTNKG